jgi:hypothetical protein
MGDAVELIAVDEVVAVDGGVEAADDEVVVESLAVCSAVVDAAGALVRGGLPDEMAGVVGEGYLGAHDGGV